VPGAVLAVLADIEKCELATPAEPLPDRGDINSIGHGGHLQPSRSASLSFHHEDTKNTKVHQILLRGLSVFVVGSAVRFAALNPLRSCDRSS
jgi:hypothetical protein